MNQFEIEKINGIKDDNGEFLTPLKLLCLPSKLPIDEVYKEYETKDSSKEIKKCPSIYGPVGNPTTCILSYVIDLTIVIVINS